MTAEHHIQEIKINPHLNLKIILIPLKLQWMEVGFRQIHLNQKEEAVIYYPTHWRGVEARHQP
jgi:hypothetical protein